MARKSIRRSQAVVPFGVGAIFDLPGQSLMSAGLDAWADQPKCGINDDRLARRLGITYFRAPPPAPSQGHQGNYLPFVRFPLWHFCPRCRALLPSKWNEPFPPRCDSDLGSRFKPKPGQKQQPSCSALPEKKRWRMVPVRFIIACEHGHIDDFPWVAWAHRKSGQSLSESLPCGNPKLRLNYGRFSGLGGLKVVCESCESVRSMSGSAGPTSLEGWKCYGNRPWLGPHGRQDDCSATPRMLQRGATNLYFPKVASAILIPPFSDPLRKIIDEPRYWSVLSQNPNADGSPNRQNVNNFATMFCLAADRLYDVVSQKMTGLEPSGEAMTEEEFRYSEYTALSQPSEDDESEFVTRPQDMRQYESFIQDFLEKVVLVEKLAETRVLTGFSRIDPPPYREFDTDDQNQLSLKRRNWLPAMRVYGEGLFFRLKRDILDAWVCDAVRDRVQSMVNNHRQVSKQLHRTPRSFPPRFFLLHTLAHILIRRLSFECGYGSSSLRERLYCWDEPGKEMMGILIYTAAGDAEGTMGGLVQQGKPGRLESLFLAAIQDARWCSSDPLCIESSGQGIGSLNRAACHACALLPETSCEEGNRYLDRGVLVGTPTNPHLGFFSDLIMCDKTNAS
ncbi:MAG: DrmB family protein [Pirellulaceae bacterium]